MNKAANSGKITNEVISVRIKPEEVDYIAALSRLFLSEQEKNIYARHLSEILEHAERLSELDTDGVEPTAHVLPLRNIFRDDEVKPSLERDILLSNAPEVENGCFKVPRIVE
ncbi:MAG: aspartyl-tRNA(Asn)/glutamyl-tRNA(Gln) amidotransferase subunit [Clostridiales bacterium]|nr:aspartyl-tRNA(Asn)/glutamyl-tRNA(Gln) amidotransferase subunit [Clostridiales bacterium]